MQRSEITSNFGEGLSKKHFCEIILKLGHWPRSKCCVKVFFLILALAAGHLVFWSATILVILVGSHLGIISAKSESNWPKD